MIILKYDIYYIIDENIDIINCLNPEEYPELCRLKEKTTVIQHLYAILQRMQAYSRPIWPIGRERYFLFSVGKLREWAMGMNYTGSIQAWQSHKILLQHAGLIQTYIAIGEQTDPILKRIVQVAESKGYRSETLWTTRLYTPTILKQAEHIIREYCEKHINLTHITKNVISRTWSPEIASSLYRSKHIISSVERAVYSCLIQTMNKILDDQEYTTVPMITSETATEFENRYPAIITQQECIAIISKLLEQKRYIFNNNGCEYHPIRKVDRKFNIPDRSNGYIITRK